MKKKNIQVKVDKRLKKQASYVALKTGEMKV